MCDQTEIQYLDGDIVWVKLGACWWPGEVWEENRLPEGTLQGLKKLPFAVVKFFKEEKFGYVKTVSDIYRYNCSRKDEFIKKGLDKYRSKKGFMEKFPEDVKKAEELTGGNPNIVDDSKYAPSPKLSYSDLYGSPVPKKKKTSKADSNKPSPTRKSKTEFSSPSLDWTPKSQGSYYSPSSSQYNTPTESNSEKKYNCYKCGYKTDRINVIIIHLKQHSANGFTVSPLSSRSPLNVSCNSNHHTPSRVSGISRTNLLQNVLKSGNKEQKKVSSPKGKMSPGITPKGKKRGRPPKKGQVETTIKKIKTDEEIKSKLLADWSDDQDSGTDEPPKDKPYVSEMEEEDSILKLENKTTSVDNEASDMSISNELEVNKSRTNSIEKSEDESKSKSCFDFEEDDVIDVIPKSPGRKIPRLITKKTKKEFEYTPEPADISSGPIQQESSTKTLSLDTGETSKLLEAKDSDESKNLDLDIDDILNKTKLPDLPEVPQDKFGNNIEAKQKPVREIMSPKERGKRIFKSKQIFKTQMQEKYGNDIKAVDDIDKTLDEPIEKNHFNLSTDKEKVDSDKNNFINESDAKEQININNKNEFLKDVNKSESEVLKGDIECTNIIDDKIINTQDITESKVDNNAIENLKTTAVSNMTETRKPECQDISETSTEDEKVNDNLSLYSITNDTLDANNIEEPRNLLSKRKSRHSINEATITKSPKIDVHKESKLVPKSPKSDVHQESKVVPKSPRIDEHQENTVVSKSSKNDAHQESKVGTKSPKIDVLQKSNQGVDISNNDTNHVIKNTENMEANTIAKDIAPSNFQEKQEPINVDDKNSEKCESDSAIKVAECLINFSESIHTENIDEKSVNSKSNNLKTPPKSKTLKSSEPVKLCLGLGSIDSSEPLEKKEKSPTKNNKEEQKRESKTKEKIESVEKAVEVPDIQSYITSKCQSPEKIIKPLIKSRLHNILTESPSSSITVKDTTKSLQSKSKQGKLSDNNIKPKKQFFIKMKNETSEMINKDIIKNAIDQIEDIETFVIEKPKHSVITESDTQPIKQMKTDMKILKKQPSKKPAIISKKNVPVKNISQEESIFDINSMPIVLSDEIITNDNLDQMQLVLSENTDETSMILDNSLIIMDNKKHEITNKTEQKTILSKAGQKMQIIRKVDNPNTMLIQKTTTISSNNTILPKNQKVYQSPAKTKILKQNPTVITQPGKPGKFIVIPSSSVQSGSKYTVGKRLQKPIIVKTTTSNVNQLGNKELIKTTKPIIQKVVHQKINVDSSGNTVLFITNSNGEQSKVVLTPDQKMKSSVTPQTIVTSKGAIINPKQSAALTTTSKPSQLLLTSKGQIISKPNTQTTKLAPTVIKQKISSNIGQTILTSKGSLITTTKIVASPGQIVQSNSPLILNKGKVLTPLTANQVKKSKVLSNQKIIVNKKSTNQPVIVKDQALNTIPQEKPKVQAQRKGFVKLSPQQLAEMEKLGFVTETSHGKIITPEGIKHMQSMTQDLKIQSFPPQRKLKSNTTLKKINPITSTIDNAQSVQQKKTIIINKQPTMPPLTPIMDSKLMLPQESIYQKNIDKPLKTVIQNNDASMDQSDISNAHIITPAPELLASNPSENEINSSISQEPALTALPDAQLLAVPGETFNGPLGSFYLCSVEENGNLTPIDNQPLYLDANNQLVPANTSVPDNVLTNPQDITLPEQISTTVSDAAVTAPAQLDMSLESLENQQIVINADGQQFILDQQSLLALSEQQILTTDGQQLILQGNAQQILAALAGNQDVSMLEDNNLTANESVSFQHDFGNKDILATALANTNVFQNEATNPEIDIYQNIQNDYKHSTVSETSSALQQPIMSPLELPSKKADENEKIEGINFNQNIDDSLAVIGVNSANIPTSLDLPITITNPEIAPKSTNPLNMACEMLYQTTSYSPVTSKELSSSDIFQTDVSINHETVVPTNQIQVPANLSMPDLNNDGKDEVLNQKECVESTFANVSMPLLNDDNEETLKKIEPSKEQISLSEQMESGQSIKVDTEHDKKTIDIPIKKNLTGISVYKNEDNVESHDGEQQNKEEFEMETELNLNETKSTDDVLNTNSEKCNLEGAPLKLSEPIENLHVEKGPSTNEQNKNICEDPVNMKNSQREIDSNKSEINIITEGLQFESEPSELLTPSTIPETIVSPRSPPCDIREDFCESSNSCEIPIQPDLKFNDGLNIETNDNHTNDLDKRKKENEDMLMNSSDKSAEESNQVETR